MEPKNRRELRKIAMTALYQISLFAHNDDEKVIDEIIKGLLENENEFVSCIVKGVLTHKNDIDKMANQYLNDWNIERLGKLDQAILRMGIYELIYTETPDLVCVDEAIELAKQFSDDAVRKMINGVLDKIYNNKSR